jgi:hypothetical protein
MASNLLSGLGASHRRRFPASGTTCLIMELTASDTRVINSVGPYLPYVAQREGVARFLLEPDAGGS